ncbi:MAG: acyl--CoA ligase, partial [Pelagibacterales bacterium]|nr:acyl--CoA ligase [Pelagibacterales bacterium]
MKKNLYEYILAHAKKKPNDIAIIFDKQKLSYIELLNNINNISEYISKNLKAKKGDRIAILSYNRIEFITLFYASAKLGTILVPINWRLTSVEIIHIIKNVGAKYLFIESDFSKVSKKLINKIINLIIIGIDFIPSSKNTLKYLKKSISQTTLTKCNSDFDYPMLIVYTSGTTGKPKGATLSQKAIYYNILNSINMHNFTKLDHILTVIPLFHVGGLNIQTIPALHIGAKVTLHKKFETEKIFSALEKQIYTFTVFVPTILETLLKDKNWHPNLFASLKAITTGSTIVSTDLIKKYENNKIPIIQVYGSTETAPIAICQKITEKRTPFGNVGKVAQNNKAKIFDEKHKESNNNIIGEIGIKGKNLFSYYWEDKDKTRKAFINGWFMTGDFGKKDNNNQFYVLGRKENIIISGGENIYPAEIEQTLNKENNILEAAILGIPDIKWQEIPIAFITVKNKSSFKISKCIKN